MLDWEMFEWDEDNLEHIALHGLEPEDAEDAVLDLRAIRSDAYRGQDGEARRGFIGKTGAGRILKVIVTYRFEPGSSIWRIRIVTARDANKSEKARYRKG